MTPVPRMVLLFATLALPLGAVLASYALGDRPAPKAPVEVRVGDARAGAGAVGGAGQPARRPSSATVRPLVVGELATPTGSSPDLPAGTAPSDHVVPTGGSPATPPANPADPDGADAKGKAKGRGTVPDHPTPSHGVTPGTNGSGG
jgi:hypothetical protein